MQLKANEIIPIKKINEFMPLQVMWEYMNVRTADIQSHINIYKYVIACLNHKNEGLPRPLCEIDFIKKSIMVLPKYEDASKEIALCRILYTDLLIACISNGSNSDKNYDYRFMIEEGGDSKNKYYQPEYYLYNLTRLIHHIFQKNENDETLPELVFAFKQACVEGRYSNINKLLQSMKQIERWTFLDNKREIFQLLLNNQILNRREGIGRRNIGTKILRLSNRQMYQVFEACLTYVGKEAIDSLTNIMCWRLPRFYLTNAYFIFSYAVNNVFGIQNPEMFERLWPDRHQRENIKKYCAAFDDRINKIKSGQLDPHILFNPARLLKLDFYSSLLSDNFSNSQQDWLIDEYLVNKEGLHNFILYFLYAYDTLNFLENRAQKQFLKFITRHNLDDNSLNLLENIHPVSKLLIFKEFFFNSGSFSVNSFCALIQGLSLEWNEVAGYAKQFNLIDENILNVLSPNKLITLELDNFDEEERNKIIDWIFNEGSLITLAFARNQTYSHQLISSEKYTASLESSNIPFALSVAILNNHKEVPLELSIFSKRFDEINKRAPEGYQISRSKFMILNTVKLVNLYELLDNYLFTFLTSTLVTSTLNISRFFYNYDYISTDYASIIFKLKEHLTHKSDHLLFYNVLLLISLFDSLRAELGVKNKMTVSLPLFMLRCNEFLDVNNNDLTQFISFLSDIIFELYCHYLNIAADAVQSQVDKDMICRLLVGRKKIKADNFLGLLDKLLTEDIKQNGSFTHFISDTYQRDLLGRRLACFNQSIIKTLEDKKIHSRLAINYPIKQRFEVKMDDYLDLCTAIWEDLLDIEKSLKSLNLEYYPKQIYLLNKSINILKKEVTKGNDDKAKVDRFLNKPLQVHFGKMFQIFSVLENSSIPEQLLDSLKSFIEKTQQLIKNISLSITSAKVRPNKNFIIKQINKSEVDTLMLGEFLSCCLAPGSWQFSAMIQRRIDVSMMMHVVIDEEIGQPVCGNWLFLAQDKANPADVYLVANFYEIRAGYGMKTHLRDKMIKELTEFSSLYARAIGAKGFLIRPLTYGLIPDFNQLPGLDTQCIQVSKTIEKIGGYFDPQDCCDSEEDVQDLYYLQAVQLTDFYQYRSLLSSLDYQPKIESFFSDNSERFFKNNNSDVVQEHVLHKRQVQCLNRNGSYL